MDDTNNNDNNHDEITRRAIEYLESASNGDYGVPFEATGPFAQHAQKYLERGYAVIPIVSGQKYPLVKEWSKYSGSLPSESEIENWIWMYPDASIGLVCGKASGAVAIDVDTEDPAQLQIIESILPPSPVRKKGKKGFTADYRYDGHKSEKLKLNGSPKPVVELMSDGNQTVLPPSPHPDVPEGYRWETPDTLLHVSGAELPELPRDILGRLHQALTPQQQPSQDGQQGVSQPGREVSGRNDTLKNLAIRLIMDQTPTDEAIGLLLDEDRELFSERPLFIDKKESNMKADPYTNAAGFYHRILQSINTKRTAEGQSPFTPRPATGRLSSVNDMSLWPAPLEPAAFYGLAGEVVRTIEPHTESDPAALLAQFLTAFGNVVGRSAFFQVEADRHRGNLFVLAVGESAKARKGTSLGQVKRLFHGMDDEWEANCTASGLSSGEGLIWAIRDAIKTMKKGEEVETDPGVKDKRLLVIESEFASALNSVGRETNTLSATVRDAWDGRDLRSLTKNSPAKATSPHISIIAHITRTELLRLLNATDIANGFGNRFLLFSVRRSKLLPHGGNLTDEALKPLSFRLMTAVAKAKQAREIRWSREAMQLWEEGYERLSEAKPGILGSMTARAEAQVIRLTLLYTLLDGETVIRPEHLKAGLAVWRYCADSCRYIFGDATGDPMADEILKQLRAAPGGMTRTEIRDLFNRNRQRDQIDRSLSLLKDLRRAYFIKEDSQGRPTERWFAIK